MEISSAMIETTTSTSISVNAVADWPEVRLAFLWEAM
jgi:hypothetical protein